MIEKSALETHDGFTYLEGNPLQVFDAETGLNQNWHREYNARQGRYISQDPIGLAGASTRTAMWGGIR
jgi:uncharacterized protein RhaS with RHS repeats